MSYVYMKSLENKAEKYDNGIMTLTLGKYPEIKQYVVDNYLKQDDKILDIGMGTGTFAIKCAHKGIKITGIDTSEKMLKVAKENIESAGFTNNINIMHSSVIELDSIFDDAEFDKITAMLSFSELYDKERDFALKQIHRILKENGELIIIDEVIPTNFLKKILYYLIRIPLVFITFLKSNLTTKPLKNFEEKLEKYNFKVIEVKSYLLDSLKLFRIKKN